MYVGRNDVPSTMKFGKLEHCCLAIHELAMCVIVLFQSSSCVVHVQ